MNKQPTHIKSINPLPGLSKKANPKAQEKAGNMVIKYLKACAKARKKQGPLWKLKRW